MYNWKTVLVTIGLLVGLKIWNPYFIENISWSWFDYLHQQKEIEQVDDIVLVDIDEKSLQKYGQFPWPRNIYADLLWETDPTNTHVFAINFSEPDRFGGDEEFAEALINRLTILSASPTTQLDTGSAPYVKTTTFGGGSIEDSVWSYPGISSPISILQDNTYGVGVTSATPSVAGTPNFDGTVRSSPLVVRTGETIYPSIALEVLRAYYDLPNYNTKVTPEVGIEWIRMGKDKPIETTSTADVMISYWNKFNRVSASELDQLNLTNKVLVWGLTAEGLNNPISTPVGVLYPHEVQANLIHTVWQEVRIQQSYYLEFLEVVFLLVTLLLILGVVYNVPTSLAAIVSLGILGLQLGGGYYFWISDLVLFDTFWSSISSLIVFGHASFNKYYITYQLKEQIKKQFEKYLSPDMIAELQKDPSKLKLGGDRKEMTFLFMDICGFTPISEHYKNNNDPEGLVELINKYLDTMTKIILKNGGTIDKYMGDCIMAFWNAPLDCEDHAQRAVDSAREISEKADELIKEIESQGLPTIDVGIGINSGDCIVGNMGSELRFDYSVIGDAVNLASRLEGQTRNYDGVRVLLSGRSAGLCKDGFFTKVDSITVKGKSEKVDVYTI
jgi:adenylate cyclase